MDTKKSNYAFATLATVSFISGILFGYQDCDIPNIFFIILAILSYIMIIYCLCFIKKACIKRAAIFTSIISIAPAVRLLFNIIVYDYDPFVSIDHIFVSCNPLFTYFSDDIPERTLERIMRVSPKTQ